MAVGMTSGAAAQCQHLPSCRHPQEPRPYPDDRPRRHGHWCRPISYGPFVGTFLDSLFLSEPVKDVSERQNASDLADFKTPGILAPNIPRDNVSWWRRLRRLRECRYVETTLAVFWRRPWRRRREFDVRLDLGLGFGSYSRRLLASALAKTTRVSASAWTWALAVAALDLRHCQPVSSLICFGYGEAYKPVAWP